MKARLLLTLSIVAASLTAALAQQQPATTPPTSRIVGLLEAPTLTKFKLDFPGGTPKQLVAAVEKALGKPLNVIIPERLPEVKLPPLKMNKVDVSDVFNAVGQVGRFASPHYSFQTDGNRSDDSVWTFYAFTQPSSDPKVCRFYSLAPYMGGLSVDDITTAIQTGWKMLGDEETPKISFHKETKLLIAVGEPSKLQTIEAVLSALPQPISDPATGLPVPAAEPADKPKSKN